MGMFLYDHTEERFLDLNQNEGDDINVNKKSA